MAEFLPEEKLFSVQNAEIHCIAAIGKRLTDSLILPSMPPFLLSHLPMFAIIAEWSEVEKLLIKAEQLPENLSLLVKLVDGESIESQFDPGKTDCLR